MSQNSIQLSDGLGNLEASPGGRQLIAQDDGPRAKAPKPYPHQPNTLKNSGISISRRVVDASRGKEQKCQTGIA